MWSYVIVIGFIKGLLKLVLFSVLFKGNNKTVRDWIRLVFDVKSIVLVCIWSMVKIGFLRNGRWDLVRVEINSSEKSCVNVKEKNGINIGIVVGGWGGGGEVVEE